MCTNSNASDCQTAVNTYAEQKSPSASREVWIKASLVRHEPCGISIVRVTQNGTPHMIGVDKSSVHELSVTSRLDPVK